MPFEGQPPKPEGYEAALKDFERVAFETARAHPCFETANLVNAVRKIAAHLRGEDIE